MSIAQRSTRQASHLVACQSILCKLFAQDWPNLCWARFNNVEVDSINTLQLQYYSINYYQTGDSRHSKCCFESLKSFCFKGWFGFVCFYQLVFLRKGWMPSKQLVVSIGSFSCFCFGFVPLEYFYSKYKLCHNIYRPCLCRHLWFFLPIFSRKTMT